MNRLFLTCIAALVIAALQTAGAQQGTAQVEKQLARAHHKATVDGDLSGAIEEYKRIVATAGINRTVAAQALVRMAECYQKLGDASANKIYEQILREYADQKDAADTARSRLTRDGMVARAKGDRVVWTGPKVDMFGRVTRDGRFITYVDWGTDQNLVVHDIVTNSDRPLTATGRSIGFSQFAEFSTISRDGQQVAFAWYNEKGRYDLRVVPLHGTTLAKPRVFFQDNDDIRAIAPLDWSPDGKWVSVSIRRGDGSGQLGLVSIADGSLRVLKSVDWRRSAKLEFSPDGRFIAYDLAAGESDAHRTVYVIAVDGSRESAIVTHPSRNVVMAWTPDGNHILFASDRSGQTALWAQGVNDGRAQGLSTMIKRDIGSSTSLGLTSSGALYVFKGPSANVMQVTALTLNDSNNKLATPQRATFLRYIGSGGNPSWSRDGKQLAYSSCNNTGPRSVCTIAIASPETGQVREVRPQLSYLAVPRWSADGQSLLTDGTDLKGRRALYRIDAKTGEISHIHARLGAITQWSPDENKIYYRRGGSIVERDLTSGSERGVFTEKATGNSVSIQVAHDGRHIAAVETAGEVQTLYLIPIAGGEPTVLLRGKSGENWNGFRLQWMPDSRAVVVPKSDSNELWLVPIDGTAHRKVPLDMENLILGGGGFAIHPDGRQIAFVGSAGKQDAEVWALENFLPAATAKK